MLKLSRISEEEKKKKVRDPALTVIVQTFPRSLTVHNVFRDKTISVILQEERVMR